MKKFLFSALAIVVVSLVFTSTSYGQKKASAATGTNYTTGLGLRLDLGNGGTFVGPAVKHFFDATNAGEFSVLFGDHVTFIGAEYSYNGNIANAAGLKWNVGIGPQFELYKGGSDVLLRPFAGLEFKVPQVPLDLGFDWRPAFVLTHGTDVEAGRFGLAFRFTLD